MPTPKEPIITEVVDAEDIPVNQPVDVPPIVQTAPVPKNPPYPQRLSQVIPPKENLVVIDLIDQLKKMTVHIPLLDALKEIPVYTKAIKEACIKQPRRKKKDPNTIHVLGQLPNLMLIKVVMPKYSDPRSLVVTIYINGTQI